MKKAAILLLIIILIAGGYFSWVHFSKKHNRATAINLFSKGRKEALAGNDLQALKLLRQAVKVDPKNAEFNYYAGISARNSGKKEEAYNFFTTAWELGKKEPEVFLNMNATSSLPRLERSKYFERMVNELNDEAAKLELSALLFFQQEKLEKAAELLKRLFSQNPQAEYAEFYAQILIRLKKPQNALKILEKTAQLNKLNETCYIILLEIYFATDQLEKAKELFTKAINEGMDTALLTYRYGRAFFYYAKNNQAQNLLEKIITPKLFTTNDITSLNLLQQKLSDNTPLSKLIVSYSSGEFKQLLNSTLNTRFIKNKFSQLAVTAINHLCLDTSWFKKDYIPQNNEDHELQTLTQKKELTASESFKRNALTIMANFPQTFKEPDYSRTTHNSRIILQTIYSLENNSQKIKKILQLAQGVKRWLEGERYYGEYLLDSLQIPENSVITTQKLKSAANLLPENRLIEINLATSLLAQNKYQKSLVQLDKASTNSLIISRSPMFQQLKATVLQAAGNLQAARTILLNLVKRGFITENIIFELYNLAAVLNDQKTYNLISQIVNNITKDYPRFYLLKASIALQAKKLNQAAQALDELENSTADPETQKAGKLIKAEIELQRDNPKKALTIINNFQPPIMQSDLLKARILAQLNKNNEALEILTKITELPEDSLELYATLLGKTGKTAKAKEQLDKIISLNPDNIAARLNLAIILNGERKYQKARQELEIILKTQPDNIRANLLLAQFTLHENNTTEAIALAQKILTIQPDNLAALQLLPTAYNGSEWYERAIISADYGLEKYHNDPFLLMQKAVALVNLGEQIKTATHNNKELKKENNTINDEIAALTEDVVFTGAMKDFSSTNQVYDNETTNSSENRSREDLFKEAELTLQPISDQPAAKVYIMNIKLKLGEDATVLETIKTASLPVNELFSLGVITDRMKKWNISKAAYYQALLQEPANPIIMNNYAWAAIHADSPLSEKQKDLLIKTAAKIPELLKGDIKAVNTAAETYKYLRMPEKIITLAKKYPNKFKFSPKLTKILREAEKILPQKKINSKSN